MTGTIETFRWRRQGDGLVPIPHSSFVVVAEPWHLAQAAIEGRYAPEDQAKTEYRGQERRQRRWEDGPCFEPGTERCPRCLRRLLLRDGAIPAHATEIMGKVPCV